MRFEWIIEMGGILSLRLKATLVCVYIAYTHTHTHTHTQMLLRLFDQYGGIEGPGKILREMDTKELEANLALHFSPINVDVYICFAIWEKKKKNAIIII